VREIFGKQVCETLHEVLDPCRCALLPIDIQNDAMRREGKIAHSGKDIDGMLEILPRCAELMAEARRIGVPIIHIQVIDMPGGASDSPAWLRAKGIIAGVTDFFVDGTWGAEFCEECAPLPGELVVRKHRSSAFRGTNLDQILRSNGIETVVIIGEQTPGCVDATLRDSTYYDYYAVLVEDCVAAFDLRLHEAALTIQRARHDVCTSDRVVEIWRARQAGSSNEAQKPDLTATGR
jgi:nicotinamidase-related amidase